MESKKLRKVPDVLRNQRGNEFIKAEIRTVVAPAPGSFKPP
jgi:hypothetical protein